MDYLALNQIQLSRLSHHWLWGLGVEKPGVKTLYDAAKHLDENPEEQDAIALQIKSVSKKAWYVSGLYWAFNIFDYRSNYYAFYAYVSMKHYEQGLRKLPLEERQNAEALGGFILNASEFVYSPPLRKLVHDVNTPVLSQWFQQYTRPMLPTELPFVMLMSSDIPDWRLEVQNRFYSASESDLFQQPGLADNLPEPDGLEPDKYFIVKPRLLEHFNRLGLTPNAGDYMSLRTLKAAYRDSLRRTHPDKTGLKTAEDFNFVRISMNAILRGFNYLKQQDECDTNALDEFKSKLVILEQELQAEVEAWKALRVDIGNYNKRVDKYISNADSLIESQYKLMENQDGLIESQYRLIEKQDRLIKKQEKYLDSAAKYLQEMKEYCENQNQINRDYTEALALQEEYEELAEAELQALETIIPFSAKHAGSPHGEGANNPYRFLAPPNTPEKDAESPVSEMVGSFY